MGTSQRNERMIIYRGNSTISVEDLPEHSYPVVVKKPSERNPSGRDLRSLEAEYEMTRALDAVEGVRKALGQQTVRGQPALILEYVDGETLRDTITRKTLNLHEKLDIAVDLAHILGGIHQQNVIHLDLNSHNILITPDDQAVRLIDLGSAAPIDRGGHQRVQPDQVLGTLPYLAPEQTGRINRAVDERSDLYCLGVVLYELLTGRLPFDSQDPMELVHHHIARVPVAPSEVSPEIPDVVSAIIMKLLEKNAEQRYQTAGGLTADLQRCRALLRDSGRIEPFPVGEEDISGRLRIPARLYGRQAETEQIVAAYERAAAGGRKLLLVAGAPGVGKSVLVREVQPAVTARGGLFAEGKFGQYQRLVPFTALTQAFTSLFRIILGEPEAAFESWRARLQGSLGDIGQVAVDLVPALERIVGPQQEVPPLEGHAAENRLRYLLGRLVSAMAGPEHPLLLFIDDVQWIDSASLGLLEALLLDPEVDGLLVVGAFRDNEVDETHIITTAQRELRSRGLEIETLTLGDLSLPALTELVSDTVGAGAEDLAGVLHGKTAGNPFFAHHLLSRMGDEGHLRFDPDDRRWRWDLDAIRGLPSSDNVVDLLTLQVSKLPEQTRGLLEAGSCIGDRFEIDLLAGLHETPPEGLTEALDRAVAGGFVTELLGTYRFVHDRVQQAAHSRMNPEQRARAHLRIGRALESANRDENLLAVADHLAQATALLDEDERLELVEIDLQAARAAGQAAAFAAGFAYARAGLELLGETGWEQHYRLTLELEEQAALLAYMSGDIPAMEHHGGRVLQFGREPLDLARVRRAQLAHLAGSKRHSEALDMGLEALRELGWELPDEPDWEHATSRMAALNERLEREAPDWLAMRPLGDQDPKLAAAFEISATLASTAFVARPPLCPLLLVVNLEHCLARRLLPASIPYLLSFWACYEGGLLGQPEAAVERCESALRLAEGPAFRGAQCRALEHFGVFVLFWVRHLRETLDLFLRAISAARDSGDNEFCAYSVAGWPKHAFYASVDLADVEARSLELRAITDAIHFDTISRWVDIYVTAARLLRGTSSVDGSVWRGTLFDEERDLPALLQAGDLIGPLYLHSTKAWLATLFGDHASVKEQTDLVEPYLAAATGALDAAIVAFVFSLRRARELRELPADPDRERSLREHVDFLERSARHAPMNFAHKLSLVQAEVHRARGEVLPAMQAYEKAAQGAMENGYLSEAGLAYTFAAEFHRDLGLHQAALHNAEKAAEIWQSWGADALVESLHQRFPDLLGQPDLLQKMPGEAGSFTTPTTPTQLDLGSITGAAQLLSAETDLEQLCTQMMSLVMGNSGAEVAVLLMKQDSDWLVQARSDIAAEEHGVLLDQPYDPGDIEATLIPEPVFDYCRRSEDLLVVGDAQDDSRLAEDRMIRTHGIRSIACIPVLSQGELKAMLYLENRQMAGAFTGERIELLRHLATQFGISVENALLYDTLSRSIQEAKDSEARFRSVVENANEAIVVAQDEVVKYCNQQVTELSGYSQAEMRSRSFTAFIHPDDLETVMREYRARVSGERPTSRYSIRIVTKDGREKFVFVASARVDWDGRPATLAMLTDLTELRKAERKVQEQRDALARADRANSMGQLTGSIAHELNQPLTGILSTAQAGEMLIERGPFDSEELGEILEEIVADTKRARDVILNLRELYREQKGEHLPLDVNDVVDETMQLLHSEFVIQDVEVEKTCASSIPVVEGNRIQIQQVLVNLIMNANQAMSGLPRSARRLRIATASVGNAVKAWVDDSGPGIDSDRIDRIFEPLATWKPDGTGMGLSISNSILEAHGGEMWAENRPEGGARVGFTLPALKEGQET